VDTQACRSAESPPSGKMSLGCAFVALASVLMSSAAWLIGSSAAWLISAVAALAGAALWALSTLLRPAFVAQPSEN